MLRAFKRISIGSRSKCWEWKGAKTKRRLGYGRIKVAPGDIVCVHRLIYEIYHGVVVSPEMVVMHTCDNSLCCNPRHLVVGRQIDNVRDAWKKNRAVIVFGERCGSAVLKDEDAIEIFRSKISCRELAEKYNVCLSTISHIRKGRAWSKVTGASKTFKPSSDGTVKPVANAEQES